MRLQLASDLHLEFPENRRFIRKNPLEAAGDILLLAGDIIPLNAIEQCRDFFDFAADHYRHTYWVPGNHEYYHNDIADHMDTFQYSVRSNVTLLNNTTITEDGLNLHFTTLWSAISKNKKPEIERGLSDFHLISYEGRRLTVDVYNQMHAASVAFLNKAVSSVRESQSRNVIVTHHVPTFRHYPPKYLGSVLNEAFATGLDEFIEARGADYWLYGHHHYPAGDFVIGNTKMITNQLGYVHLYEHGEFNNKKSFSLS